MSIGIIYHIKAPWHLARFLLNHAKPVEWGSPHAIEAQNLINEQIRQGRVFVGITDVIDDDTAEYAVREGA